AGGPPRRGAPPTRGTGAASARRAIPAPCPRAAPGAAGRAPGARTRSFHRARPRDVPRSAPLAPGLLGDQPRDAVDHGPAEALRRAAQRRGNLLELAAARGTDEEPAEAWIEAGRARLGRVGTDHGRVAPRGGQSCRVVGVIPGGATSRVSPTSTCSPG